MPVPKRKTSKARRDQRQSCKFIRPKALTKCKNCDEAISPHMVCSSCGFYKGRKILTTKKERNVKRHEVRQARAKQKSAEQPTEPTEQS